MKKLTHLLFISLLLFSCADEDTEVDVFGPIISVDSLSNTDFVSTLNEKLKPNQNQIYCSTLPYAWFEIKEGIKGKIKTDSKSIKRLNKANDYQNSLTPSEINTSSISDSNKVKVSTYFEKSLPFTLKFERNNQDLKFENNLVESFGLSGYDEYDIQKQIDVIYYKNDNNFALKLLPKDTTHEIFIYLPQKNNFNSLSDIVKSLQKKIDKSEKTKITDKNYWRYAFLEEDKFSMPILSYHLEKNYPDIEGQTFEVDNQDYLIEICYQRIAFILDESGAKIESEAEIEYVTEEIEEELPQPKNLILNQPFFIMFKRVDSDNPYLAMWIDNDELMKKK